MTAIKVGTEMNQGESHGDAYKDSRAKQH